MSIFMQDQRVWNRVNPHTWEYNYPFAGDKSFKSNTYFEERGNGGYRGQPPYLNTPVPAARVRLVKYKVWAIDMPNTYVGWHTVTTVDSYEEATGVAQLMVAMEEGKK